MMSRNDSDTSIFSYNSFSSLAKAVVFRSLAYHALKAEERIGATVFSYYSLFHLVTTLMYFCPGKLEPALLDKLRNARGSGETDPSSKISHEAALRFAKSCISDGLDPQIHSILDAAKNLREFVNYGPRTTVRDGSVYFGPCTYQPSDCDTLFAQTKELFSTALKWALKNSALNGAIVQLAPEKCLQFFKQRHLFYLDWSKPCIEESINFIAYLRDVVLHEGNK